MARFLRNGLFCTLLRARSTLDCHSLAPTELKSLCCPGHTHFQSRLGDFRHFLVSNPSTVSKDTSEGPSREGNVQEKRR